MTAHFRGVWAKDGQPFLLPAPRAKPAGLGANRGGHFPPASPPRTHFAVAYVSTEHYIYYWDWSFYWLNFETLGELAAAAIRSLRLRPSVRRSADYPLP